MTPEQKELLHLAMSYADTVQHCRQDAVDMYEHRFLAHVASLLAQARAEEREAVKAVITGGSFFHDQPPVALWAKELIAAIDRDAAIRARKDGQ